MQIKVQRIDQDFRMEAANEAGHTVVLDAASAVGGHEAGMRPMQLLLAGIGSCSAIDIISILRKQRQPLEDIKVTVDGEREVDKVPSLFTKIHLHYDLFGNLNEQKVKRAVELSVEQYCSVAKMVEKVAEISYSYTIAR
ncbi:MAG: OsmC family protein [Tunicatimonas sp.]